MAAAVVMSYPLRNTFNHDHLTSPSTQPRSYPGVRAETAMPQSPRSSHRPAASTNPRASEDQERMSLPSISNLLGIADASRPESSQGTTSRTSVPGMRVDYGFDERSHSKRPRFDHGYQQGTSTDSAPNGGYAAQEQSNRSAPTYIRYSPLMDSTHPSRGPSYVEADQQATNSRQPPQAIAYERTQYAASPSATSDGSVYSPNTAMHRQVPYGQQGPPHGYPPPAAHHPANMATTNPWEHHHYISASAQQGMYPTLPDRYICQTCNKAFSRPSSLKIHSHSHTGEKPFTCPHEGCGKSFSVKSNMKRHQKGCHTGSGQATPGAYMDDEET